LPLVNPLAQFFSICGNCDSVVYGWALTRDDWLRRGACRQAGEGAGMIACSRFDTAKSTLYAESGCPARYAMCQNLTRRPSERLLRLRASRFELGRQQVDDPHYSHHVTFVHVRLMRVDGA